ncbi:hypothetical protein [Mycolicibacterium frederiksbergense]|uniref:hypothetical protein n=1 Tax=Mycolicibacterium frederiksbergense TaxID=117567 RepID=UPI00265C3289|nr:hypothetical protein [Mycolicibacterium frederiksbergense]MDO0977182.1 hypothetical protein [Mycolicibacterium frederiksbergense]
MSAPNRSRLLDGLVIAGTAVVLTGPAVETALQAALIAIRSRRANGLPDSPMYRALATALAQARSGDGHADVREHVVGQHFSVEAPTVPIATAADRLDICDRQARRLAPALGGRKIGGRWFVDEQALAEYIEMRKQHDASTESTPSR